MKKYFYFNLFIFIIKIKNKKNELYYKKQKIKFKKNFVTIDVIKNYFIKTKQKILCGLIDFHLFK